ncbi:MAG: Fe-S cluster assembly protein HesB [Chloroflexaceae bacterium]|nr:Fe-S cluster assembly protein HesB [Chloroflexaceae bacterium]
MSGTLLDIYTSLRTHFGSLHGPEAVRAWWPLFGDDPPFEMLLGAVLVQQTRWEAVEGAILRLKERQLLTPAALAATDPAELALLLRPVAFHTQKAPGIIALSAYISQNYGDSTAAMLNQPTASLRQELLALPRIGPETADVVLLYGGGHPVFVVDAYTRRLFSRLQIADCRLQIGDQRLEIDEQRLEIDWEKARYEAVRATIEQELAILNSQFSTLNPQLFADYHALINEECVRYCLSRPRCDGPPARRVYSSQPGRESYLQRQDGCPLRAMCAFYKQGKRTNP